MRRPSTSSARAGARFRNEIVTGFGGKQILVLDPSGNLVELFEPTRREAEFETDCVRDSAAETRFSYTVGRYGRVMAERSSSVTVVLTYEARIIRPGDPSVS